MEESTQEKFTQTRWFIFLSAYLSLMAFITGFCALMADGDFTFYHEYLLWGGVIVVILCLLLTGRDSTWFTSLIEKDWADYRRVKRDDKPFQRNLRTVMLAGAAVWFSGYLWMKLIFIPLLDGCC